MASVNKVILMGNVGRDVEIRYASSGKAIANVSLATTSKRKSQDGTVIEDTQWHRVTLYERLAEIAGEYVKKGSPIYIEGRIKYGKYTDQAGVEKNTCDIVATELQLLGSRPEGQQALRQEQQRQAPPAQRQAPARQAPAQRQADPFDDDSDIPL